jgi:hypothetical protein
VAKEVAAAIVGGGGGGGEERFEDGTVGKKDNARQRHSSMWGVVDNRANGPARHNLLRARHKNTTRSKKSKLHPKYSNLHLMCRLVH